MEEMNKEIVENTVTEIVEGSVDKLTFGENVMAYGIATVFGIGVIATGYLGYKGSKALVNKIKSKKEKSIIVEEDVTVEYEEDSSSTEE